MYFKQEEKLKDVKKATSLDGVPTLFFPGIMAIVT
jgi:hypothetical protein